MIIVSGKKIAAIQQNPLAMTQGEMADAIGISQTRLSKIQNAETAGMRPGNFRRLAELLKITPAELFAMVGIEGAQEAEVGLTKNIALPVATFDRLAALAKRAKQPPDAFADSLLIAQMDQLRKAMAPPAQPQHNEKRHPARGEAGSAATLDQPAANAKS